MIHPTKISKSVIRPLSEYLKYLYPSVYMLTDGRTVRLNWLGQSGFMVFCPPLAARTKGFFEKMEMGLNNAYNSISEKNHSFDSFPCH